MLEFKPYVFISLDRNKTKMIPKTIHYCWFGKEKYPPRIKECIRSWKKILPDYTLKLWDESMFDFQSIPYMKKCYEMRKWAYVADYVRLYALYTEGGIYLDTDVQVLKSFNSLLDCNAFWGIDALNEQNYAFPESGVFGSVKGFHVLEEIMDYYRQLKESDVTRDDFDRLCNCWEERNRTVYRLDGSLQLVTAPVAMEYVLQRYGFKQIFQNQILNEDIHIWAEPIIQNHNKVDTPETIAHHHNVSSWFFTDRGPVFKFCYNHPRFMPFYKKVEQLRKKK